MSPKASKTVLENSLTLLELIEQPIIVLDANKNILFSNSYAQKFILPYKRALLSTFSNIEHQYSNAKSFEGVIKLKKEQKADLTIKFNAYRIKEIIGSNSDGYLLLFRGLDKLEESRSKNHIPQELMERIEQKTKALRESEKKYRMLFDNLKDGIYITTPGGKFLDINHAMVKIFGYDSKEDLLSVDIGEVLYLNREDRKAFTKELHKKGYVTNYETNFRKKNGDIITCLESSFAIKNDKGEVVQFQGIMVDITERKKLEEQIKKYADQLEMKVVERTKALQETEAKYSTLFQKVPVGVYISSPEGKFLDVNDAMIDMFGYDNKKQMLAIDIEKQLFLSSEDRKNFLQQLREKGYIRNFEIKYKKKNGEIIDCLESSYAIKDERNNILSFQGTLIDITKRKNLEEKLKEYSNKLEQKVKEKTEELIRAYKLASLGRLTAGVAHEIDNPLLVLDGTLQVLLRNTEKKNKNYITFKQMHKVSNRIKNIVEKLLLFSHPRLEKKQKEDINLLINNTLALTSEIMKKKNIVIQKDFQAELPKINVLADQLQQVFMNLILNAYDSVAKKGILIIKTWHNPSDKKIFIGFEDTGSGIKKENLAKVFDPFFTTKEVGKGTGLGLSISYGIVKSLGGTIEVESEVGKGTKFTITLPA